MKKSKKQKRNDTLAHIHEKNVDDYELRYENNFESKEGCFVKTYDCLVNYPELTVIDRAVYSVIRSYSEMIPRDPGDPPTAIVTNDRIACRTGFSESAVSKSISHLQSIGVVGLYKSKNKNSRIIEIQRDFAEIQKEELMYKARHPEDSDFYHDESDDEEYEDEPSFDPKAKCSNTLLDSLPDEEPNYIDDDDFPFDY